MTPVFFAGRAPPCTRKGLHPLTRSSRLRRMRAAPFATSVSVSHAKHKAGNIKSHYAKR